MSRNQINTTGSVIFLMILSLLGACAKIEDGSVKPPLVYRIDIQQGNVVDQSMINKLMVGMDKEQVRFIMGSPLLVDSFHQERWDYLYTLQEGGDQRYGRHIALYFEDDKLVYVKGDIKVAMVPAEVDETNTERFVVVPGNLSNKTLLERWLTSGNSKILEETPEETPVDQL